MFKYNIYNLKILSEISLSDIKETQFEDKEDIKIILEKYTGNPELLNNTSLKFENNEFEMIQKDIGIFNISENTIKVIYSEKTTNEEISLFVLGTCIGYLLYKNDYLPIHGSSIYTDKGAVFFIGNSGHGKSTLLNTFISKNYKMISDDIIGLKEINNQMNIYSSFPRTKIWKDTAEKLNIETNNLNKIHRDLDKFSFPIPENLFFDSITKPYIVYDLIPYDKDKIIIENISNKAEIIKSLYINTYRLSLMNNLFKHQLQFNIITKLAGLIKFRRVYRPKNYNNIIELSDLIEKDFLNE